MTMMRNNKRKEHIHFQSKSTNAKPWRRPQWNSQVICSPAEAQKNRNELEEAIKQNTRQNKSTLQKQAVGQVNGSERTRAYGAGTPKAVKMKARG
jgi:hypothetical protein